MKFTKVHEGPPEARLRIPTFRIRMRSWGRPGTLTEEGSLLGIKARSAPGAGSPLAYRHG